MGVRNYPDMMTRFRRAFASADRDLLSASLAPGFEWHTHTYRSSEPTPGGRVIVGVDAMVEELEWRTANWRDVRFDGLNERFAPGLVTQTFTISGIDRGMRFHVAAVDLYDVTDDDKIVKKDTYWKYAVAD